MAEKNEQKAEARRAEDGTQEQKIAGVTTRDDANDLGVPMLAGAPDEPTGPEDALGEGPKRGDYTRRLGVPDYDPHCPDEEGRLVSQRERVQEIGEAPGKGGVTTARR